MAARFPVSATAVNYQIKAAWSSKIKAIFWPAGEDSLHMLRPGDTTTTLVTRSASGATYNSTEGRIEGTASAPFAVEVSGGLGVNEDTAGLCFGASVYGDVFNFAPASGVCAVLGSAGTDPSANNNGLGIFAKAYEFAGKVQNNPQYAITAPMANDVASLVGYAIRHDQSDGTAKFRVWVGENGGTGAETTGFRQNPTAPNSSTAIGGTGRPLYVGQTKAVSGNTKVDFESAWLAVSLADADMVTLSTNPADVIEEVSASVTITLTDPVAVVTGSTAACTITRGVAASGDITYNLTSSNTGVATVPATATILDGTSSISFNITGVSAGSSTITATNAADSGETDTATANVSALKGLTVTFGQTNLTGLTFAWFDQASPDLFAAPTVVGTTESTDGSGVLEINLTGTSVAVGNTGFLLIYKAGATAPDDIAFFGRLTVQDIG